MANEKAEIKEPKDQSAALQREQVEAAKTGGPPSEDQGIVVNDGKTDSIKTSAGPAVDEIVVLDKDVYAEFTPKNAKRPSHILLFHKGQEVRKSELEKRTAMFDNSAARAEQ